MINNKKYMTKKKKKYISLEEKEYRKRLRDSERIEKLKPLIQKANNILKHTKAI